MSGSGADELDRLSQRLLAAAAPMRLALATTDAEREAAYRLRYQQVVAHGWAPREALPGDAESDAYDAEALHVVAWEGDAAAGTLRLVLPAAGRRLPVEDAFELDVEPRGAVVEAGRLVVAPEFRGDPAHRIWGALLALGWLSLRERGFCVLAGTASAAMVARMRSVGLPFEILGPARPYWGEDRHPVRLDPADSRPGWF